MKAIQTIHSFCSYCGAPFLPDQAWPRTCPACGNITYRNPLPVAVCLVPVNRGVVLIRRAIHPGFGGLALPGGFVDYGESWQQAARREVWEETGIEIDARDIQPYWFASAPDSTLIVFGLAKALQSEPVFQASDEVSEIIITRQPVALVFGLHTAVLHRFFTANRALEDLWNS